ncbi:MAG: hypothetical protein JKY37_29260 [Nannocystaceae bacterium]|nr:hypothetical protein [Nannocystaceae bacterium]
MSKTNTRRWIGGLIAVCLAGAIGGCEQQDGTVVGPRGATMTSDDGRFTLEVPAGALAESVEITIDEVDCEPADAVDTCYEVGPVGLALLTPARVIYDVDTAMFDDFQTDDLALVGEGREAWSELADPRFELLEGSVSASAVYLTSYALVVTR